MFRSLTVLAIFLTASAARAEEAVAPSLAIGDKAPTLSVEKWVKGSPVEKFEKGKVYVVEFWATWCPPCVASMPHLTELQKKHKEKGLTIIGTTTGDQRGNSLEAVEKMVKSKGDEKMGYTVAWDKADTTNKAYMEAAGQSGIPCSFVVNQDGLIAYIGHPMGLDDVLDKVISGKYDLKEAQALNKLRKGLENAMERENWPEALKDIDGLLGKDAKQDPFLAFQKFQILLTQTKDYEKAYAVGKEVVTKYLKDEPQGLNAVAWIIIEAPGIEKRDLDLALKAAELANDLTKGKESAVLDTLAMVHFKKGSVEKAIDIQKKAIELGSDQAQGKAELEEHLKQFEEAAKASPKDPKDSKDSKDLKKKDAEPK